MNQEEIREFREHFETDNSKLLLDKPIKPMLIKLMLLFTLIVIPSLLLITYEFIQLQKELIHAEKTIKKTTRHTK